MSRRPCGSRHFASGLGMGTSGPEARSTVRPEQRLSSWSGKGPKVDYKELLKPEEFEVFSRLREWRKAAAEN